MTRVLPVVDSTRSTANMVAQLRGLVGLTQMPEIDIEGVG